MSGSLQDHYQRLRAEVGKERSEPLGAVSDRDLRRFAVACGEREPSPGGAAPPLFLSSVMGWGAGPPESQLDVDGTSANDTRGLALNGVRLMGAGQELELHAPVTEGVNVVAHTSVDDVRLKQGRSGPLLILRLRRRFTDDAGRPLVTCRESFIAR